LKIQNNYSKKVEALEKKIQENKDYLDDVTLLEHIPSSITATNVAPPYGTEETREGDFRSLITKEYAEEIDTKHLEAMESLGVSKFIIYKNGILSNLKPFIISVYFLILESSIRGASVLGLVGAGGIGQRLWQELNHLRYDRVSLIILILVILIFIIDLISFYFRNLENNINTTYKVFIIKKNVFRSLLLGIIILIIFENGLLRKLRKTI